METGHPEVRDAVFQMLCNANRTAAGTSAAVRRGECFVKIQVHDVKAHVSGTHNAHERVHVGAVVV